MTSQLNPANQNYQNLMDISEEEQFQQVCELLEKDVIEALRLATATLKNKKHFQALLEKGLDVADASEIEVWLKYIIPRIGLRHTTKVLESKISLKPRQVENALYWLSKFANRKELELVKNLENKMLGENYKVISPSGMKYKLILRIKSTNECAIFGGYQLGSHGSGIIAEILDPQTFYPTGGVKVVSPGELEILDPQPYND